MPPAIQALLAARLDRLEPDERRVLACASIEGEIFHVAASSSSRRRRRARPCGSPMSLVRKELLRPEPSDANGEVFRFRHALIRDAAYEGLSRPPDPSSTPPRRLAGAGAGERADEFEEFLGYHLEQAYRYRAELHGVDEEALGLADRAPPLRWPRPGGLHFERGDTPAAMNLLERARALPASDERAQASSSPLTLASRCSTPASLERAELAPQ